MPHAPVGNAHLTPLAFRDNLAPGGRLACFPSPKGPIALAFADGKPRQVSLSKGRAPASSIFLLLARFPFWVRTDVANLHDRHSRPGVHTELRTKSKAPPNQPPFLRMLSGFIQITSDLTAEMNVG